MSGFCETCTHRKRKEIEAALIRNVSSRVLADEFGVSRESLQRHKALHLPETLTKAHEAQETLRADSLLGQVSGLIVRARGYEAEAATEGNTKTALLAIREQGRCYDLLFRAVSWAHEHNSGVAAQAKAAQAVVLDALKDELAGTAQGKEVLLRVAERIERNLEAVQAAKPKK